MSKYTTELRFICENAVGLRDSKGYDDVNSIIKQALPKIFNFSFPIFDENYREVLETKILKHYYTREICEETIGLWRLRLDTKLNEIMPYYNQLYKSELLQFNPLYTHNITRTHDGTSQDLNETSGTIVSSNEASSEVNVEDKYSDTPQGGLTGVKAGTYLTNAEITDTTTSGESSGTVESNENGEKNTTEHYLETVVGYEGKDSSELLLKYRETFLNIDMQVINELEDLFFQLW